MTTTFYAKQSSHLLLCDSVLLIGNLLMPHVISGFCCVNEASTLLGSYAA
jgi:hypothetical protein